MNIKIVPLVRWLLLLPIALVVTGIVQIFVFRVSSTPLMYFFGPDPNSVVWISKSLTAPFMGAAFVSAFWLVAPSNKNMALLTSLLLVAVWSAILISYGISSSFLGVFSIGALGLVGAVAASLVVRERAVVSLV